VLKKYLSVAILLPFFYGLVNPSKHKNLLDNIKAAIYFEFGTPSSANTYKYYNRRSMQPTDKVEIEPNMGMGLVLGYNFIFN
jgi:hypothetical protein